MEEKRCSHCKIVKSILEFNKNKRKKDGLQDYCIDCRRIYNKPYKIKFQKTEKNKQYQKEYHQSEKGKLIQRISNKKYYLNNTQKVKDIVKNYMHTEKGKVVCRESKKRYRLKYPEKVKEYQIRYILKQIKENESVPE